MSSQHRYSIAGSNGRHILSIPLEGGRNQRIAMEHLRISDTENWQRRHWRTLTSCYNRTPYFPYFSEEIEPLFKKPYSSLEAFSTDSIRCIASLTGVPLPIAAPEAEKDRTTTIDLRNRRQLLDPDAMSPFPEYSQAFQERTGFIPDLSILDLLFNEGKHSVLWLKNHGRHFVKMLKTE